MNYTTVEIVAIPPFSDRRHLAEVKADNRPKFHWNCEVVVTPDTRQLNDSLFIAYIISAVEM